MRPASSPEDGTLNDPLAELLSRSQRGDKEAFSELVTRTQRRVYNLAYRVLGNRQEAEDLTQEVYVRAWRALPRFRGESKFSTWLYRITTNACFNRRRRLSAQLHAVDERDMERIPGGQRDPAQQTIEGERRATLWASVGRLPAAYRLAITLFYQEQLSYVEIAEMLSLPVGTVKSHLNRARRALAEMLRSKELVPDAVL